MATWMTLPVDHCKAAVEPHRIKFKRSERALSLPRTPLASTPSPCKLARMLGRCRIIAVSMLAAVATALAAHAEEAGTVAGTYCLAGVHEVGSCLRLFPDGKFEYFLAYGAYDETSEGTWRLERDGVILDSPAYDHSPAFSFKRTEPNAAGAFDVIVEDKDGKSIPGIEVAVSCDGRTKPAGVTQAEGFKIDCTGAPAAVMLGLSMFGLAPQTIDVASHAGGDKAYVFEFDPGDLGKKKFVAQRLRIGGDALEMTYSDTPIQELQGRPFRYVRERGDETEK